MPEKQSSKTAKILYRPWGLVASMVGGLIAGQVFQKVWQRLDPDSPDDPPKPLHAICSRRRRTSRAVGVAQFLTRVVTSTRGGAGQGLRFGCRG